MRCLLDGWGGFTRSVFPKIFGGAGLLLCLSGLAGAKPLELGGVFQDHAVFQRERPIAIWGTARAGAEVVITLGAASAQMKCGDDGLWSLHLPALSAGGPYVLRASDGVAIIERKDILIGDVWLCSGQSNMVWTVGQSANASAEIAAAAYPEIRFITIPRTASTRPQHRVGGAWVRCSPESVSDCSAVAYYFAKAQWLKHRVPVGLVIAAVGGSTIQPWISRDSMQDPVLAKIARKYELWPDDLEKRDTQFLRRFRHWVKVYFRADEYDRGGALEWVEAGFDDAKWRPLTMPDFIERQGIALNGVFWLRRELQIPSSWAGRDLILDLGRVDDSDITYYNGQEIGSVGLNEAAVPSLVSRIYKIPKGLVQAGRAVIAIRVSDYTGSGGMNPETKRLELRTSDGSDLSLDLKGVWKYAVEQEVKGPLPPPPVRDQETSLFFNGMISPLVRYGLRGFLWYQGESNSNDPLAYRELFPLLIGDWRRQWEDPALPFLFVQLAGFDPRNLRALNDPDAFTYWVYLREAQGAALSLPGTEMASAIDLGDAQDIHPPNKQEVGRRLSLGADRVVHGMKITSSGPRFKGAKIEGGRVRVEFAHAEGGLKADGDVEGFALAGWDRKFHWARAMIHDQEVEVSCPSVPEPVSVRYAWEDDSSRANLKNSTGLPAEPFRLDQWDPY